MDRASAFLQRIILIVGLICTANLARAQDRVALVIGNSIYDNGPDLKNPVNDASAISAALSGLGYRVYYGENLNYSDMSRMLLAFAQKIGNARQVLVYFAGHGVQVDGVTFLMPTDAVMRTKDDLITSITLNEVLELLRDDLRASIVLVDACRNNPIYESIATRSFANNGESRTQALFDLPYGMLIGYASRPGAVAYDGPLQHSPYAEALLSHMATPGLDVELMLRRVRNQVVQITKGAQVPWTQSSLLGEVAIVPDHVEMLPQHAKSGANDDAPKAGQVAQRQTREQALQRRLVQVLCGALQPPLPAQCEQN